MRNSILILFALFFLLPSVYSQSLQKEKAIHQLSTMLHQADAVMRRNNYTAAPAPEIVSNLSRQNPNESAWESRLNKGIWTQIPQQAKPKLPAREGKPWQMALFLASQDRPLAETLGTIRWSIRHGYIQQATILDFSPTEKNQAIQFYILYTNGQKDVTDKMSLPADTDTNQLFEVLIKHFQQYQESLQTGVIIDAHANPDEIYFDRSRQTNDSFTIRQLMNIFSRYSLHIDVIQLISCHVGSIANVELLANNHQVDYAVISSDLAIGNSERFYYSLIQYACYPAKKAARMASNWTPLTDTPWRTSEAVNAMALDLTELGPALDKWGKSYTDLCSNPGDNIQLLEEENLTSFRIFVKKQTQNAQKGNIQAVCQEPRYSNVDEERENFIQSGEQLLTAIDNAILNQWCLPPNKEYFARRNLSAVGCTDGPSINKTSWEKLWTHWINKYPYRRLFV